MSMGHSCRTPLSHKQQEWERQFTDYKCDLEAVWCMAPDTRRWHSDRRAERLEHRLAAEERKKKKSRDTTHSLQRDECASTSQENNVLCNTGYIQD